MTPRGSIIRRCKELGFTRVRLLASEAAGLPFPSGTFVLCGLSCHRREIADGSRPGDPHGLIAPFARRNYYREAVLRLKILVREIGAQTGVTRSQCRIFCNSRLPEKRLAARAGLGFYGRNSLIIAPELGSLFVIAGVFVPLVWEPDPPLEGDPGPGGHCGTCRACIEACPTGAVSEAGRIDPLRCIQALSTDPAVLADDIKEKWGARLYGCQTCQDVCFFNRELEVETETCLGELGPSLPLRRILEQSSEGLRASLKASVLDRKWIPAAAIQRNAVLAAGSRRDRAVQPLVERYRRHALPGLSDAAEWALRRFSRSRFDKADL